MKKFSLRTLLGLLVLIAIVGDTIGQLNIPGTALEIRFPDIPFIDPVENLLYDWKLRQTMPRTADARIVIIDIDEKSLAELGRWPWGRDRMAALVDKLFDQYFVSIVGFDVIMAEPDFSSGLQVLDRLARRELKDDAPFQQVLQSLRPALEFDNLFAQALRKRRTVLGYYFTDDRAESTGALPAPVLPVIAAGGRSLYIKQWRSYGGNLPLMQAVALAGGHFNPGVDADGSLRRVPMLARHGDHYYESFSLAMVRALLGSPPLEPVFGDAAGYGAIEALRMVSRSGALEIPVDVNSAALVPYRGPRNTFRYIAAADVLADRVKVEDLADKIILVGSSAPGLLDLRSTPVGSPFPGVEVHANLISGMLDANIRQRPQFADAAEALLLLAIGLPMIFLFPWRSPIRATLATAAALGVVVGLNMTLWQAFNWVLPLAPGLLMVALLFIVNMSLGYFLESRAKKQFTQLFGQYVPPELVEEMSRNPQNYSMAGRRAELTVLFSDVRGFTTISEGMPPEALAALMNEYLGAMTQAIRKRGGTLDKYIGDAIMAFWGAPVANPDHAREAVLSAFDMLTALEDLNRRLEARGTAPMKIGIGINTGPMTVGDMGSEIRLAYTVMGDAVNLGARIEGRTKEYGVPVMVGENTRAAVPDVVFRELDRVQVKGKEQPVAVYEPIGLRGEIAAPLLEEIALWSEALEAYRQQQWDAAGALLIRLQQRNPQHGLYRLYSERVAALRVTPPGKNWDGVTRFDTK